MNLKNATATLERAEKAGLRIVVDPETWAGDLAKFPLDEEFSPVRCDIVKEARRLADSLDRPKTPPEGCVYRHATADIEAAFVRAAKHIATHFNREKSNDESDTRQHDERVAEPARGDGDSDDGHSAGHGKGGRGKDANAG